MAEAAFLRAARAGNLHVIKGIIKHLKKSDMSTSAFRDAENCTALHLAAMGGYKDVCQFLVEEQDHTRLDPKNSYGETPLFLAVLNGHSEIAIYLIEIGADALVKSAMGFTLLHQASKLGQVDLMNVLIKKGANVEAGAGHIGTPLFYAAASGKLEALNLLLNHNAKVNTSTADFLSPLVAASAVGSLPCVKALIEGGASIDVVSTMSEDLTSPNNEVRAFLHALNEERDKKRRKKNPKKIVSSKKDPKKIVSSNNKYKKSASLLSDKGIEDELKNMLACKERDFFSDWSPLQRRLFYKSTLNSLKRPTQIFGIDAGNIQSVIFDITDPNKAQASFLRAICCYRAWHFSGTDLAFEFGEQGQKVCVSRKDGAFVFWFRDGTTDVGTVINGQYLWAEGFLRRRYDAEKGRYIYKHPLQFRREDFMENTNANLEKSPALHDSFMVAEDLEIVDYSGSYKGSVADLNLHVKKLKIGIRNITNHVKGNSFQRTCHFSADRLVLYSTESGKNNWAFQYTMFSLNPKLPAEIRLTIPDCLDATVVKHRKVSLRALLAVKQRLGRVGEYQEDEEYKIVPGAPFRVLSQVISAYTILRREVVHSTKLFLDSSKYDENLELCKKMERCTATAKESDEERERKVLEKRLKHGTLFMQSKHGGEVIYEGPLHWPMPHCPTNKKRWYYYKVIEQDSPSQTCNRLD